MAGRRRLGRSRSGTDQGRDPQGPRSRHQLLRHGASLRFGASEQILGEALADDLRARRDRIVIATKGGLRMDGDRLVRDSSPGWLRQGLENSLRALAVDYVDVYQVHWSDPQSPFSETANALGEFVREGKIRYVGVSNYDTDQMAEFEPIRKLDTSQPPYHMFRRDAEEAVLPYCLEHGIGVLVYGPLAHGLLSGTMTSQTTFPPNDWRSKSALFRGETFRKNLAVVERLKEVAERLDFTVPQLAIAWTLNNPALDAAIVGVRNPAHLDGLSAASGADLDAETLATIDAILAEAVPVSGPEELAIHDGRRQPSLDGTSRINREV